MEGADHNIRLIIHGEVDGYETEVYVYDTDIERGIEDEDADALPYEPGVVQWVTRAMKEHNITPRKNRSSESSGGRSRSESGGRRKKKKWECPVHGDDYVKSQYKYPDKMECDYKEEADEDDDDAPDWANPDKDGFPRYSKKDDAYYWYCKHRER